MRLVWCGVLVRSGHGPILPSPRSSTRGDPRGRSRGWRRGQGPAGRGVDPQAGRWRGLRDRREESTPKGRGQTRRPPAVQPGQRAQAQWGVFPHRGAGARFTAEEERWALDPSAPVGVAYLQTPPSLSQGLGAGAEQASEKLQASPNALASVGVYAFIGKMKLSTTQMSGVCREERGLSCSETPSACAPLHPGRPLPAFPDFPSLLETCFLEQSLVWEGRGPSGPRPKSPLPCSPAVCSPSLPDAAPPTSGLGCCRFTLGGKAARKQGESPPQGAGVAAASDAAGAGRSP